jgi:hypothetical protein
MTSVADLTGDRQIPIPNPFGPGRAAIKWLRRDGTVVFSGTWCSRWGHETVALATQWQRVVGADGASLATLQEGLKIGTILAEREILQ